MMIVEGFDDGIEPVEGDGTQVKGADSTGMNINRVPQITDRWTKNPPARKNFKKTFLTYSQQQVTDEIADYTKMVTACVAKTFCLFCGRMT